MKNKTIRKTQNPRFINFQKHKYSCGVIALANALKWLGYPTSYKNMLGYCIATGQLDLEHGMLAGVGIPTVLKSLKIKHRRFCQFKTSDLDKALAEGHSVLLSYVTEPPGAFHAVFIDKKTPKTYSVWNKNLKNKSSTYHRKSITKLIRRSLISGHRRCYAYIIYKEN